MRIYSANTTDIELDVPPVIIDGRTMVPIRAIAEAFNSDVQWNGLNNSVYIMQPQYDYVGDFYDGLAVVFKDGKCGYINKKNEVVIPIVYDWTNEFWDGYAVVYQNEKYGIINTVGEITVPLIYDSLDWNSNQPIAAEINGKYGYIDLSGNTVIPFIYDFAGEFYNSNYTYVHNGEKYGLIDKEGNIIIPFEYNGLTPESDCVIAALATDKYGAIDYKNNVIIPFIYDYWYDVWAALNHADDAAFDINGKTIIFSPWIFYVNAHHKELAFSTLNFYDEFGNSLTFDPDKGFVYDDGTIYITNDERMGMGLWDTEYFDGILKLITYGYDSKEIRLDGITDVFKDRYGNELYYDEDGFKYPDGTIYLSNEEYEKHISEFQYSAMYALG